MKEIQGDFWIHASNFQAICVTTNGVVIQKRGVPELVMGAGLAKQFKNVYPHLPRILGDFVQEEGNIPNLVKVRGPDILSFPTKDHYRDPSPIKLVQKSAELIVDLINQEEYDRILSVRPGCGLGGLAWDEIKPVLQKAGWDDRFTIISP